MLLIIVLAVIIIGISIFRLYLGNQAKKLSEDIAMSADIATEIDNNNTYQGKFINESDKRRILSPNEEDYQRVSYHRMKVLTALLKGITEMWKMRRWQRIRLSSTRVSNIL